MLNSSHLDTPTSPRKVTKHINNKQSSSFIIEMGIIDIALFGVLLVNTLLLVDASRNMPFAYQNQLQRQCSSTKYTSLCVQTLREFQHGSFQGLDFVSFLVNKTILDSNMPINRPPSSSMASSEFVSLEDSTYSSPSASVSGTQRNPNYSTVSLR